MVSILNIDTIKTITNSFVSRVGVIVVVVVGRLGYGDGRRSCCSGLLDRGDDCS